MTTEPTPVGGPWYDDIAVGDRFDGAPGVTLTDGLAAAHRAIVGGRFHLASDADLSRKVTGKALASAAIVWDTAIGQSTLVTGRAIANLFYRGLVLRSLPAIGDTLRTSTRIIGKRAAGQRADRSPRGLVVMHIVTTDQRGETVLDFHRCAMIAARANADSVAGEGELEPPALALEAATFQPAIRNWNLGAFRAAVPGPHFVGVKTGAKWRVDSGDVVSSAPELARLTHNLAGVHHDAGAAEGQRLVYGGHTIGLAATQVTRALPALVTILGWASCDHTGPVREGDTLFSQIEVERTEALREGGLVHLRVIVEARAPGAPTGRPVLDWRLVGLMA